MLVGVLEDDDEVREAVGVLLGRLGHGAALFADTSSLLAEARAGRCPPVVLVDLEIDGVRVTTAIPELLALAPGVLPVALTGHFSDDWVFSAIEAGVVGYVLKTDAFDRLGDVIEDVVAGGVPLSREVARRVLAKLRSPKPAPEPLPLSPRELDVLRLLADGYRYEQIGLRLEVSLGSVQTYVRRLYTKLGVTTKSEATALAMRRGWLS